MPGEGRRGAAGLPIALVSALAFGGSGVVAKPLIEAGIGSLQVVWLRAAGAALVMLPLALGRRAVLRRRPGLLFGFGLLGVAGVQACFFAALSRIPVGVALLVEYLAPALVLGWVRFVQRRPVSRSAALGVVLAVAGLAGVVEVWHGLSFDPVGLLLAVGAACCQVGYFVLSGHSGDGADAIDPLAVIAHGLLIGAVLLTVVSRPWDIPWHVLGSRLPFDRGTTPAWLLLGWMVLIATVLAYLTGVVSVRRLSPAVAGVVACLEAVVATVLAWVLLGERLAAPQLFGGALVLVGAFTAQRAAPAAPPAEPVAGAPAVATPPEATCGTAGGTRLSDGAEVS